MKWNELHELDSFKDVELDDDKAPYMLIANTLHNSKASFALLALLSGKPEEVINFVDKRSKCAEWLSTWLDYEDAIAVCAIIINEEQKENK